jgi:hypothetical protein
MIEQLAAFPFDRSAAYLFFQALESPPSSDLRVKTLEFFVPLQYQMREAETRPLRIKIVRFKSRNCAH